MRKRPPIRIALAIDEPIFRRGLVSLIMSLADVQLVGEALDVSEALQLCELVKPDILLLNLKDPLLQDRHLIRVLGQSCPLTKTVLFSEPQARQVGEAGLEQGSVLRMMKDISEEEFLEAIFRFASVSQAATQEATPETGISEVPAQPVYEQESAATPVIDLALNRGREIDGALLAQELITAGKIQADILPERPPSIDGWDIAARLEPAQETSGDFYDFIPLANGHWGIVVADVTDKGLGAALFMALSSTLIRSFATRYPTLPALTMDVVNERILADTRGNMFITAFFGVLEPQIGRFRYVNAGHPPAYLISKQKGKPIDRLRPTGMALGVMENFHWQQKIVKFKPGDVLLLYTDGVTEVQNGHGVYFGEPRLLSVVQSKRGCSAKEIQDAIISEVRNFTGDTPRQDDIALIVMRRAG